MKTQLYLNLKTSWQGIWEVVRTWVLNNKNTLFESKGDLPQRRPSGSREWKTDIERVKAIQLDGVLRVTYEKRVEGVTWYTELYFKRARRSIYTRVIIEPRGAVSAIEIKLPRIVAMLQKRFGNMNEKPVKKVSRVEVEKCRGKVEKVGEGEQRKEKRPKVKRGMRVEKSDNIAALVKVLRTHAFEMLKMDRDGQLKLMKTTCGKSLAKEAGVREKSVGKLIDLKWRKHVKPAETLQQFLYIICTDDTIFQFFESAAKGARAIWEKKSNEELYALIKGVMKAATR